METNHTLRAELDRRSGEDRRKRRDDATATLMDERRRAPVRRQMAERRANAITSLRQADFWDRYHATRRELGL